MPKPGKKYEYERKSVAGGFRPLSKYGYEDFMKLALNSFNGKKYARAVDNCRLAVEIALKEKRNKQAAEAYELWIKALFEEKKLSEIKRICCEARSKLGNYLDLLYYEFDAALLSNDKIHARRFANEYLEMLDKGKNDNPSWGMKTAVQIDHVKNVFVESNKPAEVSQTDCETGRYDGQKI